MDESSKKLFEDIFKHSPNGIVITTSVNDGENFRIEGFNPKAEQIDKIKREDVIGKLITEAFPGIKDFSLLTTMRGVHKTGQAAHHPVKLYKDDKIVGWRENYVYKTLDGLIVNVYQDKTDEKIAEQNLKNAVAKNESIIKALPDLFFKFNPDGVYIDCWTSNPKLLLVPVPEIIGKKIEEILPKHIAEKAHEFIREVLNNKEPKELEYDLNIGDIKKYFEARLVFDTENTVMAIVRDVTEHKEMIEKIKESEEKFRKIFRASPDAILLSSVPDGKILDANEAAEEMSGYSAKEMIGKTTTELGFWAFIDEREKYIKQLTKNGRVTSQEVKFKTKTKIINALISGEITDINNKKYFVSVIRDISELRRINKELNLSEEKFRDIAENISEIVLEMNSNCIITFINSGCFDITGYTAEEIIGTKFLTYFTEESAQACDLIYQEMVQKRDSTIHNCKADFIIKSGGIKILQLQWKIVFTNGTGSNRTYMVARDITEDEIKRREQRDLEEKQKKELREKLFSIESDLRAINNKRSIT